MVLFLSLNVFSSDRKVIPGDPFGVTSIRSNQDSLSSMIDFLVFYPGTKQLRTRFCLREAELKIVADSLADRLEKYTGQAVERIPFEITAYDSTFISENIVGRIDATGPGSGVFLITAHYDAIASRTRNDILIWFDDWENQPAPGADDNATGVAALLEAARVLAKLDLPFDLKFILFSGEELVRLGSIDYMKKCDFSCVSDILGVINMDMIGYSGNGTGVAVMSDHYSGWLAALLVDWIGEFDPSLAVQLVKPAPWNWDHASFWENQPQVPAITFAEPLGERGSILYPYYHTLQDLPDQVDIDMTSRIADITIGFISQYGEKQAEIAVSEFDLLFFDNNGVFIPINKFSAGDQIVARVGVRNIGGEAPSGDTHIRLLVEIEGASGREAVFDDEVGFPEPLRSNFTEIEIYLDDSYAGGYKLKASVKVSGFEDISANNSSEVFFAVEGGKGSLIGHHFCPNPIKYSFSEALFCLNLAQDANILIEILSLEGNLIGSGELWANYGYYLSSGYSCHRCSDIFRGIDNIASGVYLYRIFLHTNDGEKRNYTGRFAVEN